MKTFSEVMCLQVKMTLCSDMQLSHKLFIFLQTGVPHGGTAGLRVVFVRLHLTIYSFFITTDHSLFVLGTLFQCFYEALVHIF